MGTPRRPERSRTAYHPASFDDSIPASGRTAALWSGHSVTAHYATDPNLGLKQAQGLIYWDLNDKARAFALNIAEQTEL
jgi:hypothetical protein